MGTAAFFYSFLSVISFHPIKPIKNPIMKTLCFSAALFLSLNSFAQLFKSGTPATNNYTTNALLYSLCYANLYSNNEPSHKPLAYHPGYTITGSNDTLWGNICLKEEDRISLVFKRNALNLDTTLRVCDVTMVRLFAADSLLNNQVYTDYVKLNNDKHCLWRQVYKGSFEIYDDLYASNERPGKTGDYLVVKEQDASKTIAGFWAISPKKNMIDYVNSRYSKNFNRRDFASVVDVINWLKMNG
jgi:hypothetical protein